MVLLKRNRDWAAEDGGSDGLLLQYIKRKKKKKDCALCLQLSRQWELFQECKKIEIRSQQDGKMFFQLSLRSINNGRKSTGRAKNQQKEEEMQEKNKNISLNTDTRNTYLQRKNPLKFKHLTFKAPGMTTGIWRNHNLCPQWLLRLLFPFSENYCATSTKMPCTWGSLRT